MELGFEIRESHVSLLLLCSLSVVSGRSVWSLLWWVSFLPCGGLWWRHVGVVTVCGLLWRLWWLASLQIWWARWCALLAVDSLSPGILDSV